MTKYTKCTICKKEIQPGEKEANIIIYTEPKTIFGGLLEIFKGKEAFVCLNCLAKGITYNPNHLAISKKEDFE